MHTGELARKFEDFREIGFPDYIQRDGLVHLVPGMASTIIGARRAGKSYRAFQVVDELVKAGAVPSRSHTCHVDFDNPILSGMGVSDLRLIQETFLKGNPDFRLKTPIVFILDEIHKILGWEEYVIDLSRNPHWKVVVTGSSSKLLRDDISTELRGKAISSIVYPLSFSEYLAFNGFQGSYESTRGAATVRRLFDEYLHWGGYPGLVALDGHSREAVLREYFDTMILKDVIQRNNVSRPQQCIQLYSYLLSNISRPHTLKSAYNYLRESGYKTSRDAIGDYIAWARDSWLLFSVPLFSDSHKEQERNYKKIYAIDWALAIRNSAVWDGSFSRAFENMIYLHLRRRYSRVGYYLTRSNRQEVDFICTDEHGNASLAVQVCLDITDQKTLKRELEPLFSVASFFNIKENFIVTMNHAETFSRDGVVVKAVPAWKWLMSDS